MRHIAFTRAVGQAVGRCELTHLSRVPIDVTRARAQHAAYERALADLGCELQSIPGAPDMPDAVFVEDTAVVLDAIVVITRPGAASRRGETAAVAATLSRFRAVRALAGPATLDGGDVLRLGRTLYVGAGARTNAEGVRQLAAAAEPHGYEVRPVRVKGCLHLKSAATELAPGLVILNPAWMDPAQLQGCGVIEVDPAEPAGANVLRIGGTVLCAAAYERTNARIAAAGVAIQPLDVSELAKAEAGVTCCSLLMASDGPAAGRP